MLDITDKKYWLMVHPPDTVGNVGVSDISVSCPICREGNSWKRKHRLHLYIKPSYENAAVACFNCYYKSNLSNYLKENHPDIYPLYKNEKSGVALASLKVYSKQENTTDITDSGFDLDSSPKVQEIEFKPSTLIDNVPGFKPLKDFKEPLDYLANRGLEPKEDWLFSPKDNVIEFNGVKQHLSEYIIVPLKYKNKWYGFQALAYKQKKFFVYMCTGNTGFKVWNYFCTDKDKPIYVFESIYDAMSSGLDNAIAVLGASLSTEVLKDIDNTNREIIFCLDNQHCDNTAKEQTIKYLEQGYKCFIWPEGSDKFKDTNDLRKINVPYSKIKELVLNNVYSGIVGELKAKMIR